VEEADREQGLEDFLSRNGQKGDGERRHSGLSMMPMIASKMTGLSVGETD
jgi:hypothetical protein